MPTDESIPGRQGRRPWTTWIDESPLPPAGTSQPTQRAVDITALMAQLAKERDTIFSDAKLSTKEKSHLLEANRRMWITAQGGTIRQTENVVYGILIFSAIVLIVLALLTAFAGLAAAITLAFVGTALGGTIATIAQKIGSV